MANVSFYLHIIQSMYLLLNSLVRM